MQTLKNAPPVKTSSTGTGYTSHHGNNEHNANLEIPRQIPLGHGKFALVDAVDYGWLSQYKWHAHRGKTNKTDYAIRDGWTPDGRRTTFKMHREILGFPPARVDHRDTNGLNCQRRNLREANKSQNGANRGKNSNNTSGYKGVSWHKAARKWSAQIQVRGKYTYLGLFPNPEVAHAAYAEAAAHYFGEFARSA